MEENQEVTEQLKEFDLDELIPSNTLLKINEKEYELRKINVEDEAWLKQFGDLDRLFKSEDYLFMCRLAFRLLTDKADFLPIEEDGYDDDGNTVKIKVTGPMRVMKGLSGVSDKMNLMKALMTTFGISRPLFDKMVEDKLKDDEQKKSQLAKSVGVKSLT